MKAQEFDQRFDEGEEIISALDLAQAKRPNAAQQTISIELPVWIIELIDREASNLGVTPLSIIKTFLVEHLAINSHS